MADRKAKRRRVKSQNPLRVKLTERSQLARDRALHAIAAMRHDPTLSLARAAKLQGVKQDTIKRYFPSALVKSHGRLRVTKSDRYSETLYLPDRFGNPVPVQTRSSKERSEASKYLRDLGRYLRGQRDALSKWHGKRIAGVELLTVGRTIVNIEPALSDFSLYRGINTGAA
jgi:hypothetical protein